MKRRFGRLNAALFICLATWAVACSSRSSVGSDAEFRQGKELYVQKICATCHHEDGTGNNPVGKALKVPNLALADFKQGDSVPSIAETIRVGVPESAMVPFKNIISKEEARLIAIYIKGLRDKR